MAALTLEIPGRLPSWNAILAMHHWARMKFKKELAAVFLSALRASGSGSSTKTISAKNTMSIYADTLESSLQIRQEKRRLKQRNAKQAKANKSASLSK